MNEWLDQDVLQEAHNRPLMICAVAHHQKNHLSYKQFFFTFHTSKRPVVPTRRKFTRPAESADAHMPQEKS